MRLIVGLLLCSAAAWAHDIITTNLTFTRDISRLFDRHCAACHGPGSDIVLTNYADARPWAVAIKEQVLSRAMPPWGAVKGFGDLKNDKALTQEDILVIAGWVIGGAPQGDAQLLPQQGHGKPALPRLAEKAAVQVATRTVLRAPLRAAALRPEVKEKVQSARVTARLPDGRIVPLVWLYQFDPKWKQTFIFREPLNLPKGTVVEATEPLDFVLETSTP